MTLFITSLLLLATLCRADGPDLHQTVWQSNGTFFVSADIPACHVARWERRRDPDTNWLSAVTVDEEVFTRNVVFSETISTNQPWPWYRVHILRVLSCADFGKWAHACL